MPEARIVLTILALIGAMVLCGVLGSTSRIGVSALALLSFVWLTLDADFEGVVLFSVSEHHGLTSSDLVGLVGFGVAAWQWRALGRSARRPMQPRPCPRCGTVGVARPCRCGA